MFYDPMFDLDKNGNLDTFENFVMQDVIYGDHTDHKGSSSHSFNSFDSDDGEDHDDDFDFDDPD